MHDQVLIIDFGSQVTQLIARRVREMGVYSEVIPFHEVVAAHTTPSELRRLVEKLVDRPTVL